jgi:hypothetical protein
VYLFILSSLLMRTFITFDDAKDALVWYARGGDAEQSYQ